MNRFPNFLRAAAETIFGSLFAAALIIFVMAAFFAPEGVNLVSYYFNFGGAQ